MFRRTQRWSLFSEELTSLYRPGHASPRSIRVSVWHWSLGDPSEACGQAWHLSAHSVKQQGDRALNWEAIAAFGEAAGAIAVVASLIFVGSQLRQGQSIERANAQRAVLVQTREWMSLLSADEKLFEAVRSCLDNFDGAGDFEKERFNSWAFSLLYIVEQVLYMRRDGFVNEGSFHRFEQGMLAIIRTRGGAQWWKLAFNIVGTDVSDHLTRRLAEVGDSVPPWDEPLPHLRRKAAAA